MRNKIGLICVILGVLCLISAVGFVFYNRMEAQKAGIASQQMLENMQQLLQESAQAQPPQEIIEHEITLEELPEEIILPEETPREMPVTQVNGYDCIGILYIPVLGLELPVLTDWSYEKFKVAPCLYYGSCYEPDFVIAAHNYVAHFASLSQLQTGDLVLFTDVEGTEYCYEVVLLETLPPEATKEMITSGFDLSLFTCTTGRGSRVTVRCSRMEP